jgi:hypothetical protein
MPAEISCNHSSSPLLPSATVPFHHHCLHQSSNRTNDIDSKLPCHQLRALYTYSVLCLVPNHISSLDERILIEQLLPLSVTNLVLRCLSSNRRRLYHALQFDQRSNPLYILEPSGFRLSHEMLLKLSFGLI